MQQCARINVCDRWAQIFIKSTRISFSQNQNFIQGQKKQGEKKKK
jgi:hypothetical protein